MERKPSKSDGILNVLLVDDDPDQRWLTRDAVDLIDRPCRIHEASSAEEALAMLTGAEGRCERLKPDVIYLDIDMPGMDGLSLLSRIKSDPRLRDIMVVMVTGNREITEHQQKLILNDADGFIPKTKNTFRMMQAIRVPIEQYSMWVGGKRIARR